MKVLVACEFSGIVRDAFIAKRGHDAISCDLLPTERPGPHIPGRCAFQLLTGAVGLGYCPSALHLSLSVSGASWCKAIGRDAR